MWSIFSKIILKHRLLILILFVIGTALMVWQASHVKLAFKTRQALPQTDSAYIQYENFKKKFGDDGNIVILGIASPKLFNHRIFNHWKNLTDEIQQIKGIKQTLSIGKLFALTKDTVKQQFQLQRIHPNPIENDGEMDRIRRQIYQLKLYEGLIFNSKNNASILVIIFDKHILNSPGRIPIIESILEKSKAFSAANDIEVHYSGLPYIRTVVSAKIYEEFSFFSGLSIIIAACTLLYFFRSLYAVLFPILLVVAGLIWSLGILGILGYDITMLTGLIPPLITIIGIPNSILLINKYHHELKKEVRNLYVMRIVIERMAFTTFIANLTTAIGFGVLYFTKSDLLMEFGVVAAISVMCTWIMCLCLIPIIFSYLPAPRAHHTKHLDNSLFNTLLKQIDQLVRTKRRWIYGITIFILALSVIGISRIRIDTHVIDDLPKQDAIYRDMAFFDRHFGGVLPLEVLIDGKKKNSVMNLSIIKKIEALQDIIAAYPEFSRAISVVDLLKFSSQAYYNGNPAFYRIPTDRDQGFILNYLAHSTMHGDLLKNFVDSNRQLIRMSFYMKDIGSNSMNPLIEKIQSQIDSIFNPKKYQATLTGSSIIFIKGANYLVENLWKSLLLTIALIALMMWILFRNIKMIFISLIPNLIPLIITGGIMSFLDIPLKPATILIFSITLGIASDQTIYFLSRYRHELQKTNSNITKIVSNTLTETGRSMIYIAFILFFGFGIFAASSFGSTAALGMLISITLLMALIFNLTLLPALLLSLEKPHHRRRGKI